MKWELVSVLMFFTFVLCACNQENMKNTDKNSSQSVQVSDKQSSAQQAENETISWVYNLSEAMKTAQSANQPVMIDFYAEWCGWCKKLDKDVYANPEVIKLSKNFVAVKVDTDKYQNDAKKYNVEGLPTIVFTGPDGKIKETFVGYRDSAEFVRVMTDILNKK